MSFNCQKIYRKHYVHVMFFIYCSILEISLVLTCQVVSRPMFLPQLLVPEVLVVVSQT